MAAPKLRFKEFDGDWFQSKIGEIFQVTSGSTPLRSDNRFFENADIVWVKTTDLNNGLIEKTEEKISQIALKETSVKILPKGTVFVAMYGGFNQIGRTGLLVHEAACNQALSAIYPNEKIDSYFLLTFLNHKVDDWKNFAASSRKDPNITKSDVLAFPLKYPVKEEQTKIASFLSVVDEKISQLTQKHALLSQYKQGMMQKLFSQQIRFKADDGSEFGEWEEVRLGNLVDLTSGFAFKSDFFSEDGNKLITPKNFTTTGKANFTDTNTKWTTEISDKKYICRPNDLLVLLTDLTQSCELLGKPILLSQDDGNVLLNQRIVKIIPNRKLEKPFLLYLLLTDDFHELIVSTASGTTVKHSSNKVLQNFHFYLPCLEEQTKIANFLSAIDQKIEGVAQQIEQAKTWKKGLLQQMFV